MSAAVIARPGADFSSIGTPEGPTLGASGTGGAPALRAMPTCHSCGMIAPPARCTASATPAHPARASSPWKRGTRSLVPAESWPMYVPSVMISPTPPAALRA